MAICCIFDRTNKYNNFSQENAFQNVICKMSATGLGPIVFIAIVPSAKHQLDVHRADSRIVPSL